MPDNSYPSNSMATDGAEFNMSDPAFKKGLDEAGYQWPEGSKDGITNGKAVPSGDNDPAGKTMNWGNRMKGNNDPISRK